jgi:hypothetical protein
MAGLSHDGRCPARLAAPGTIGRTSATPVCTWCLLPLSLHSRATCLVSAAQGVSMGYLWGIYGCRQCVKRACCSGIPPTC